MADLEEATQIAAKSFAWMYPNKPIHNQRRAPQPETALAEFETSEPSWLTILALLALILGIVLVVIAAPLVLLAGIGAGDCMTSACEQEGAFWIDVFESQAPVMFGWPALALVVALVAVRLRWAWLVFSLLCAIIALAGLVVIAGGIRNPEPHLAGLVLPAVSPGFVPLLPSAISFSAAGIAALLGRGRR